MIDLYTWSTPNGRKASIMLEEIGLDYEVHPINIGKDDQFAPEFLKIAPNNKIPAIVERETGFHLMESGAILMYLAEKTGKLMPYTGDARWRVIEWLMWQMGGTGPFLGQAHHFVHFNPDVSEYARNRYAKEAQRLYGVLDRRLGEVEFLAGEYSIADIATWPWISRYQWQNVDMNDFPNVKEWYVKIAERPAVQKGYNVPATDQQMPMP
ncbi:MAG: glutathione S-transferase N-terminal domain-containing protein [Hyphomicrobiales bacterium]